MRQLLTIITALTLLRLCSGALGQNIESPKLLPIRLNGKGGYIDREGHVVIKPRFMRAWEFSEGLAPVQINDAPLFAYINDEGNYAIGPWHGIAFVFSDGLGLISRTSEGRFFIDRTGKTIMQGAFFAESFSDGMAQVILDECIPKVDCGLIGYVDKVGHLVIKPQFRQANDFHEGLAAVSRGNFEWTFIDKRGKEITKRRFIGDLKTSLLATTDFSEGVASVKVGDKWGYIDKTGELVIAPQFEEADKFSEGLAAVFVGCRWGYIDKTGTFVVKPQFKFASEFSEGLAAVDPHLSDDVQCPPARSHDKLGYIDKTGKLVIGAQFDLAFKLIDGVAKVMIVNPKAENDFKYGYIEKTGKYIWWPTS